EAWRTGLRTVWLLGGRRRRDRATSDLPPRRQLRWPRVHVPPFVVGQTMHWQPFLRLPPLHRAHTPTEIRSNFFPRVQTIVGRSGAHPFRTSRIPGTTPYR